MLTIGIDPGNNGGATILDADGRGVAWAAWRPRKGRFVFVTPAGEKKEAPADFAAVGIALGELAKAHGADAAVSIEGLIIRKTGNVAPSAILTLAFGAGALFGGLASVITVGSLHRPTPEKWARLCGGTGQKQSEAAFRRAKSVIPWVCPVPSRESVGSFECLGAIGEAAMMALWARNHSEADAKAEAKAAQSRAKEEAARRVARDAEAETESRWGALLEGADVGGAAPEDDEEVSENDDEEEGADE